MADRSPWMAVVLFCALFAGCASGGGGGSDSSSSDFFDDEIEVGATFPDVLPPEPSSGTGGPAVGPADIDFQFRTCATPDLPADKVAQLASLLTQSPASRASSTAREGSALIPVVFHVITKGSSFEDGQVPDEMLVEQIEVLNRAYSGETGGIDTPFRFELAGINRVNNPAWFTIAPGTEVEREMKAALRQGGAETLNIYLVNTEGGILGFATFPILYLLLPEDDGVVINFRTLPGGPLQRYNTGHVAVHEAGHWLGLLHTFQGECELFGDLVDDTPAEKPPGQGEFCPVSRDSCPDNEGLDPVHNHMTYTVDSCRTEFTPGQLELMRLNTIFFRNLQV